MLTPSEQYSHLAQATAPKLMKPVLERELTRVWRSKVHLSRVSVPRVLLGKDGRLLIQYCLSVQTNAGEKELVLFGQLLPRDEKLRTTAYHPEVIFLPHFNLIIPVFPFDPKLRQLRQVFGEGWPLESPPPWLKGPASDATVKVESIKLLGYRPERRAVLGMQVRQEDRYDYFVVRMGNKQKLAAHFAALRELELAGFHAGAEDQITVPHPTAPPEKGLLWLEGVPDPALHELKPGPVFAQGCASVGRALKKLHHTHLANLPSHTIDDELALLGRVASQTGAIYPQVAPRLESVRRWVEENTPASDSVSTGTVHRDFYDKQILIGTPRITLLDVDTMAIGDPALDLGNFLAHLRLRACQSPDRAKATLAGRKAFTLAYQSTNTAFWRRVHWWETASLLRLVCVYSLRPQWQDLAVNILGMMELEASLPEDNGGYH